MIKELEKLNRTDKELLLKAPAVVSVLACVEGQEINEKEKADAMELAHLRTFTAEPELQSYYKEVEKVFKAQFETICSLYAPFTDDKMVGLREEAEKIKEALSRLTKIDRKYGFMLYQSLNSYFNHVKTSGRNILEYFIFPFPVPGITD